MPDRLLIMKLLKNNKLFLSLVLLGFFWACSDTPPEIIQYYTQPNLLRDETSGEVFHQFSVFLHLEDEDGTDDIESIFLIHDEEELFWELNSENWTTVTTDSETWIGSNGIAFPGGLAPAKGLFRIFVLDAAGERTVEELYIQPPEKSSKVAFPQLDIRDDGSLFIKSTGREHTLWYYDDSGSIVESHKTSDRNVPVPKSADRISQVYVYSYSDENGCGVISGPYQLPGS